MREYDVSAHRVDARGGLAIAKAASLVLDIDPNGRADAFNPAELLLAAFAACILKGVERATPMLHFQLRQVSLHVHGVRRDSPPRFDSIHYEILVDTDEIDRRLELLHANIRKYGTIFNTLASAVTVSGTIRRSPLEQRPIEPLEND